MCFVRCLFSLSLFLCDLKRFLCLIVLEYTDPKKRPRACSPSSLSWNLRSHRKRIPSQKLSQLDISQDGIKQRGHFTTGCLKVGKQLTLALKKKKEKYSRNGWNTNGQVYVSTDQYHSISQASKSLWFLTWCLLKIIPSLFSRQAVATMGCQILS